MNAPETTRAEIADRTSVLFVVILSSFLAPFMISALNVALPAIGTRFALDAVALGWVVTSYILAAAVVLLPAGRAADIHGRKATFLLGMIIYVVGSALSAAAPSFAWLIAARVVNAVGAAMGFATGTAILMSVIPARERGRVLGWNVAAVYLGLALGPPLGGLIAHALGWRWIFILNALAGLIAVAFTVWKLTGEWADARGEAFDGVGSVLYGLTLMALMGGCSLLPGAVGAILLLASAAGLGLFVRWEVRSPSPLLDLTVFTRNAVFAFSNLAALINYAATAAVAFLLSLYLEYVRGLSAQQAGLVLMAQPVVMAVCSPAAGRFSDRVGPGLLASLGMTCTAGGLLAFGFLRAQTSLGLVAANLAVLGFGFALFSSPNTHAIMGAVERKDYGMASGTLSTMRLIGQMLSMAIVMLIMALSLGHVQMAGASRPLLLRCIRVAFAVFAGLCVLGVFASIVRGKAQPASAEK